MSGQTRASASATVQFIRGMGSVRKYLECSTGDFYQRYTGPAASPTQYMPDYADKNATLTLRIYDTATGLPVSASGIGTAEWWFGTTQITFNAQGVATGAPFAGLLERGTDAATGMPQLKVKGNLVAALNGLSVSVKCDVGYTADDGTVSRLIDVIPYSCMEANDNDYACHITGDMTIREHGGSVTLSVDAYRGVAVATPKECKWERYNTSLATPVWETIGTTAATVTINEDEVDSSLTVRCTVTFASGATAIDTATVNDVSDPVQLLPCPTPEDSVVYDPTAPGYIKNVNDKVTYAPVLSTTDDRADAISGHSGLFNFRVLGPAGEEIQGAAATGVATYTLKGDTLRALGYPSVLVVIDTTI